MAGKGSRYRPVNRERYNENYDRIFRKENVKKSIEKINEKYDKALKKLSE